MAKKHIYYELAEKKYVYDQKSIEEISKEIDVSIRTLQYWKAEGHWDEKRSNFINTRMSFHEELYGFARMYLNGIMQDIKEGKEISNKRLEFLGKILQYLKYIKEYEDIQKKPEEERKDLKEIIEIVEKEILGIK